MSPRSRQCALSRQYCWASRTSQVILEGMLRLGKRKKANLVTHWKLTAIEIRRDIAATDRRMRRLSAVGRNRSLISAGPTILRQPVESKADVHPTNLVTRALSLSR